MKTQEEVVRIKDNLHDLDIENEFAKFIVGLFIFVVRQRFEEIMKNESNYRSR